MTSCSFRHAHVHTRTLTHTDWLTQPAAAEWGNWYWSQNSGKPASSPSSVSSLWGEESGAVFIPLLSQFTAALSWSISARMEPEFLRRVWKGLSVCGCVWKWMCCLIWGVKRILLRTEYPNGCLFGFQGSLYLCYCFALADVSYSCDVHADSISCSPVRLHTQAKKPHKIDT